MPNEKQPPPYEISEFAEPPVPALLSPMPQPPVQAAPPTPPPSSAPPAAAQKPTR